MTSESNKRIAKNTLMLYIRMLLTMVVSLYTSRVVLSTLGIEDFGIYNVIAGFVVMVGFMNNSMASATQRFLSYEIGKSDASQLNNVFLMSVNIHIIIGGIILILAETVGLWVVNTQLTIPPDRLNAAKWVYQFSILSFLVNVISVPYNAAIIAHERMSVFAWVSIIEVSLKLFIVFVLQWFGFDKLKFYAVLMFVISLIIRIIYGSYCSRNFPESKFKLYWNKSLSKTLMSFAGWTLWGNGAGVIASQGINLLLNIFFGPVVNAARGIAFQVKSAVHGFYLNFQMAVRPQIIKSYAADNFVYMHQLILQSAKFSYYLLFIISLPLLFETEYTLSLWLKEVPDYTVLFVRLVIIDILIDCISGSLIAAVQATGKIKIYQTVVGSALFLVLPFSYFFLRVGGAPEVVFYISIIGTVIAVFLRIIIVKSLIKLPLKRFLLSVISRILLVSIIAAIIPYLLFSFLEIGFIRFCIVVLVSIVSSIGTIYLVGLSKRDKEFVSNFIYRHLYFSK